MVENLEKIQLQGTDRARVDLRNILPDTPGIYIFFADKNPIYIGKAVNLKRRVLSYFDLNLETKTARMVENAKKLSFIRVTSDLEALLLEARLIRKYMPQYNITAKDDKHPLYIIITKEKYPRVLTGRKVDLKKLPVKIYFGPFPSAGNVRFVLKLIRRIFPYADHRVTKRGCLNSHIGLCKPCPSDIEALNDEDIKIALRKEYLKNIRRINAVLSGKFKGITNELEKEMQLFSKEERFEEAKNTRDQIQRLSYITSPQIPAEFFMENPNLYEDLRRREMKTLQKILLKYFKMGMPQRVECFDIAHLAGTSPTASMVTFVGAEPEKKLYRHFKIYQNKKNSDVDSLREVIKRRLKHLKDWGRPDLIIVDGGKPQVGVFVHELRNTNIPVVGLAKKFETLVIPTHINETVKLAEYKVPRGPTLNFLQRIRDEAHRFARVYHHKLLSKAIKA